MKIKLELSEKDLHDIVESYFHSEYDDIKDIKFDVSATGDMYDRPTGHSVSCTVSVENKHKK